MPRAPLLNRIRSAVSGHWWTVVPHLRHRAFRAGIDSGRPWSTDVACLDRAPVRLTGVLHASDGANTLALIVHGLGGDADAGYCLAMVAAARRLGWACLRVNLRGADGRGEDFYHAALSSDLGAVLDSPAVASFRRIVVVGFSLGGHLAFRYALDPDPRVTAVTAVCSPVDLARGGVAFDRRRATPYRMHILRELKSAYRRVSDRGAAPTPWSSIHRVTTIRGWDRYAVVPRFGFDSVDAYYAQASVGPHLAAMKVPAVYVGATYDPIVPAFTVRDALRDAGTGVTEHWIARAGHVGFAEGALFDRIAAWTDRADPP